MATPATTNYPPQASIHNFVPQDDYYVRLCAICGRGKLDCLESNRRRRPMPPVITCSNCGLTYYQTAAPHVCAKWGGGPKESQMNNDDYTDSMRRRGLPNKPHEFMPQEYARDFCAYQPTLDAQRCGLSRTNTLAHYSPEREPPARTGDDRRDGSKRYFLSEIEHLLAERERLLKAAQFSLTTPGFIRGRDELQKAVDAALDEQGKDGKQ